MSELDYRSIFPRRQAVIIILTTRDPLPIGEGQGEGRYNSMSVSKYLIKGQTPLSDFYSASQIPPNPLPLRGGLG